MSEAPLVEAPLSDMTIVAREVFADLKSNVVGYALAGTAYLVATTLLVVVAIGLMGLCIAPGLVKQDETLIVIGAVVGMIPYMGLIFAFVWIGFPLMSASLLRALHAQRTGGDAIGFGSLFAGSGDRTWPIVLFYILSQMLIMVGGVFFYIPGLIAFAVTTFAFPIVVFEDATPVQALQLGWDHVRRNAAWHAGVWILLVPLFVALEITVIGLLFAFPLLAAYQLIAYRTAFGPNGALTASAGPRPA